MESNLKKFNLTIKGLALILFGVLITEIINIYKLYSPILWANWLVYLPALALTSLGLFKLMGVRKEFRLAAFVSLGALASIVLALTLLGKGYLAFGINAFVSIRPVFFRYFAEIGALAIYYLSIKGFFQLMARSNVDRDFHSELKNTKKLIIFTVVTMVFVPFGHAFTGVFKIIICAVFLALNTFCKLGLLKKLNSIYSKMYVVKSDEGHEKKTSRKSDKKMDDKEEKKAVKKGSLNKKLPKKSARKINKKSDK